METGKVEEMHCVSIRGKGNERTVCEGIVGDEGGIRDVVQGALQLSFGADDQLQLRCVGRLRLVQDPSSPNRYPDMTCELA